MPLAWHNDLRPSKSLLSILWSFVKRSIHCVHAVHLHPGNPRQHLLLEPPPALGLGGDLVGDKQTQAARANVAHSNLNY
jgi:hypothetical protein